MTHTPPPHPEVAPSGGQGGQGRSLWHHADFRRLWAGDTASQLGVALGALAIPYLAVTVLHANEFQMGLLATLGGLGFLIIGLPAGAIVDRYAKRSIMLLVDLLRALLLLSLPVAGWLGLLGIVQVMVVATAIGMSTVFFDVSYQSYLPLLVHRDHVVEGNAKLQASQSVSMAAGPAIGGLVLTWLGALPVIGVNAVGYLLSAVGLSRIRHRETPAPRAHRRPMRVEIAEGLRFIVRHPLLRRLIACTGLGNLAGAAIGALIVLYQVRDLHLSALTIGIVDSAAAVGGLFGALITTRLARRIGEGAAITVTAAAMLVC
ncbi:MFS transporter [Nakamurella alba]|uniref:MFS transporter n=1 Tax=Nakamurella alba TaxID=2665158 RepID=UPI0018AB14AB|nr:MFS transporter [Nakamurella alba]